MSGKKKSEVKMVLKSAEKTRQDIFDARFNELDNILKRFNELSSKFPVDDFNIEQELVNIKDLKEELSKLNLDVQNLQNKLASIDPGKTNYFDREYQEAESYLNKYRQINESLKDIYIKIEGKISDILQRNKDSEIEAKEKFKVLKSQMEDKPYTNPLDPNQRQSLEELIKNSLKQPDLFEPLESLVKSIEKDLDEKNFISALNNVNKAFDKISEVKNQCEDNLIKLKERIEITMAIEDALKSFYYEYETQFIDGDPNKGIYIRTINSNDISILIPGTNDDSRFDVELNINDHLADCRTTADELAGKLNQMGVSFEIKDYGSAEKEEKDKVKINLNDKKKGNM